MNPVGVFKRGEFWWYKVGRDIRKSSGSKNIEDAIALRARAVASANLRMIKDDWRREVESQSEVSKSWLRRTHASVQKRSRLRGWSSCLTLEELSKILLMSGGVCALTGIKMLMNAPKRHPFSMSIDRVNSELGYSYGNVRLVCLAVNLGMSHWGEEALMQIARALVGRELIKTAYNGGYSVGIKSEEEGE